MIDGTRRRTAMALLLAVLLTAGACGGGDDPTPGPATGVEPTGPSDTMSSASPMPATVSDEELAAADLVLFTGEAPQGFDNGGYGFEEGEISSPGPTITVPAGKPLTLVLLNVSEEFIPHDVEVVSKKDEAAEPLWGSQTPTVDPGESTLIEFTPGEPGTYFYICSLVSHLSGHGMWGRFIVT